MKRVKRRTYRQIGDVGVRRMQKPLRHVSLYQRRNLHDRLERAFSEEWERINERLGSGSFRCLLQQLLMKKAKCGKGVNFPYHNERPALWVTQRDATIAATLIQWLGTGVGFNFLRTVLAKDGYEIRERADRDAFLSREVTPD